MEGDQGPCAWEGGGSTTRAFSVCAEKASARLGFPGALLQSRDVWMWFGACLPSPCIWASSQSPSAGEPAPEQRAPGCAVCPGLEAQFPSQHAGEKREGGREAGCRRVLASLYGEGPRELPCWRSSTSAPGWARERGAPA